MSLHLALLGLTFTATLASTGLPSAGAPCEKVKAGPHVAAQPEAWRRAVEALVASTATPGLPWSCAGGEIDLVARGESAEITVTTAEGAVITREVAMPEDVQPLGEALLARPLSPPAPVLPATPPPVREADPALDPPRVLLSATIGPRYAGPDHLLWGGVGVGAALPFGPWGGGLWIRFDGVVGPHAEHPPPSSNGASHEQPPLAEHAPPTRALSIGGSAFRGFDLGPLTLRAALRPALAVVTREGGRDDDEETRFDFRLGAEGQMVIPFHRTFRALIALDGELSPRELGRRPEPRDRDRDPTFPKYTFGLGVGLEVAIR